MESDFELPHCDFAVPHSARKVDKLVSSTVEGISPIVDDLMRLLKESCCSPEEEFAVEVALREAITNAVVHGNAQDPSKKVRICCSCDAKGGNPHCSERPGEGFDSSKILSPVSSKQIHSDHGRGIYLIKRLMDEVQFRHGGSKIYIRKDFRPPQWKSHL